MKTLEALPFAVLLAATGAVLGAAVPLLMDIGWGLAAFGSLICAVGGYFGGVSRLAARGLPAHASMAEFLERDG